MAGQRGLAGPHVHILLEDMCADCVVCGVKRDFLCRRIVGLPTTLVPVMFRSRVLVTHRNHSGTRFRYFDRNLRNIKEFWQNSARTCSLGQLFDVCGLGGMCTEAATAVRGSRESLTGAR